MMHVYRTRNKTDMLKILTHPDVLPWLIDDLYKDDYTPVIHDSLIYLMNKEKSAVIRIEPMNGICCQAHLAILPEARGIGAEFCQIAGDWVFKNTLYRKIVVMIPAYNKAAIRVVQKYGMIPEGIITKAYLKDWELHDLVIYGISKHKEIK